MTTNEENMSNIITTQASKLGALFGMEGDGTELVQVLKATAFKGEVSDAQMVALLTVANHYGLNPFTKELFAFPDKNNGIVPVVGVDGWSRIINSHPQFDGIEFHHADEFVTMPGAKPAPEWIECHIHRKDRSRPVVVREYLDEVYRAPFKGKYGDVTGPWQTHTKRFLRHKAMIQCARLAFGYGGIYDQDEAERIVEAQPVKHMGAADVVAPPPATYNEEKFNANFAKWAETIQAGRKTAADYIQFAESRKEPFTEEQKARLLSVKKAPASQTYVQDVQPKDPPATAPDEGAPAVTYADLAGKLRGAQTLDALDDAASLIAAVASDQHQQELEAIYDERAQALGGE